MASNLGHPRIFKPLDSLVSNLSHPQIFKTSEKLSDKGLEGPEALKVNLRLLEAPGKT